MIEKMKFISLTGRRDDIDRIAHEYLSPAGIHLENALTTMKTRRKLYPFIDDNPYRTDLNRLNEMISRIPDEKVKTAVPSKVGAADIPGFLKTASEELEKSRGTTASLQDKITDTENSRKLIVNFTDMNYDISKILEFRYINFEFGRMPLECEKRFDSFVNDRENIIFLKTHRGTAHVYGVMLTPKCNHNRMQNILTSLQYEKIYIPDGFNGTPAEVLSRLEKEQAALSAKLEGAEKSREALVDKLLPNLLGARDTCRYLLDTYDIRQDAAIFRTDGTEYYLICGWIPESRIPGTEEALKKDPKVIYSIYDDIPYDDLVPPTRLKNPKLFRPYELYTTMYGLPNYQEFDPTILVALTYSFIFGAMYGDAGQGLCLFIGGLLLYKFKGWNLAGIISLAGIFSTFFGFMFGSFFGFENVVPALWLKPRTAMMKLPLIGNVNTVFVVSIALGMGLILLVMILNVILAFRRCDTMEKLFGTNSIAGVAFYGTLVFLIVLIMSGHTVPAVGIFTAILVISLICMFLKEPLSRLVDRTRGRKIDESVGMFIVENFFELFEVLLSFFSNTLSFVRIGAFAISHAAMMGVVLMLAGAENGSPNWIVIILGNIFVMGLEGLVVGIQVLRLEYYELFSRFYSGNGKPYRPFVPGKASGK